MRSILLLVLCILFSGVVAAQSPKKKKKSKTPLPQKTQPGAQSSSNSLQPYYPAEDKAPKKSKGKPSSGPTYESEQQYFARMEQLVKDKRKAEKEMMKPQYSNPAYFGHKRPPKKHKAGKLKFCKECGIRH